jgi:HEAT repeat protein
MSLRLKTFAALLALSLCAASLVACEQPDWTNPEYISKRLVKGDSATRAMALQHLDKLETAEQKKVAPALAKVYLEAGPNQKDVMQVLVQLRSPAAKDAYLKEVRENATGYAGAAAEALGDAGVTEALPDLIALYKSTDDMDTKQGLLRAFSHMPDPKLVPLLTETLNLNVDNYPIALHAYSCEILGDIAQKTPQALDDAAKQALVKAMFLGNMAGQTVSRECGLAIQQLGAPAVPLLLKTFQGKNKAVNTLLARYNKPPNYSFPANRVKSVAAVRLGALKANAAVAPFVEDLESVKEAPKQISGEHAIRWRVEEARATSEIINGLGVIGDASAVELLAGIVKKEKIEEEWDEITDYLVEIQLRQDAAFALVRIGDRSATDALLEMAENGLIVDLEKLAARIQDSENPMPIVKRYQFNWMMAQSYAFLVGADGVEGLAEVIRNTEEPELKKKMSSFIPAIEKGAACLKKGDDKAQAACFGAMLASEDLVVRKKAAFELSRLPAAAAGPVVAANLGKADLATREILTFAAYKTPSPELVPAIDKILEDEANKGAKYDLDHHRLKLLRAWLKNNSAAVAQK